MYHYDDPPRACQPKAGQGPVMMMMMMMTMMIMKEALTMMTMFNLLNVIDDDDDFSPLQQKASLLNLFEHLGEYFQSIRILIKH